MPPDHGPAILELKMEVGRLKCCVVTPQWAPRREKVLIKIASLEKTVAFLQAL